MQFDETRDSTSDKMIYVYEEKHKPMCCLQFSVILAVKKKTCTFIPQFLHLGNPHFRQHSYNCNYDAFLSIIKFHLQNFLSSFV